MRVPFGATAAIDGRETSGGEPAHASTHGRARYRTMKNASDEPATRTAKGHRDAGPQAEQRARR